MLTESHYISLPFLVQDKSPLRMQKTNNADMEPEKCKLNLQNLQNRLGLKFGHKNMIRSISPRYYKPSGIDKGVPTLNHNK